MSRPSLPRRRARTCSAEPMRENLHRFFRAARGAGVHVSPAESIDAMRAVAKVGFAERSILRDTLLLTLAKTAGREEGAWRLLRPVLLAAGAVAGPDAENDNDDGRREPGAAAASGARAGGGGQSQNLGPLAQMLLSQDRNAIAAAIANAAGAARCPTSATSPSAASSPAASSSRWASSASTTISTR